MSPAPTSLTPAGQELAPGSGPPTASRKLLDAPLPSPAPPHPLYPRYLLFMKLAALQLMQQKASKIETPTSLENGDTPSSESKPEDLLAPEAGGEEEGSNASGLAKVKELAETIASDDGTGGAAGGAAGQGRLRLLPSPHPWGRQGSP